MTGRIGVEIEKAASLLKAGRLVAIPTETVYGLAALAGSDSALDRLYEAKGRPRNHPVIVHIAEVAQLEDWAIDITDGARLLAESFWPGPLTMVLKKRESVSYKITGGQETVAIRIPKHPLTLSLLKELGEGIVAPSANKFGRLSPTRADDVDREFQEEVAYILEGGPCDVGIESTILNLSSRVPEILRPGRIHSEELERVLGAKVTSKFEESKAEKANLKEEGEVRVPGALLQHYAPVKPLYLIESTKLRAKIESLRSAKNMPGLLLLNEEREVLDSIPGSPYIVTPGNPETYARLLYSSLRELDASDCDCIIVESIPDTPEWSGVKDRLKRAAVRTNPGRTSGETS